MCDNVQAVLGTKSRTTTNIPIEWVTFHIEYEMEWNEFDCRFQEAKSLMGVRVHRDDFKIADYLEWWSAVASKRYILILTW